MPLVLFIFDKRFFSQLFAQFIHETDNEPTCLPCADRRINTIAILKWWTLKRHFDKARDYALFTLRTFIWMNVTVAVWRTPFNLFRSFSLFLYLLELHNLLSLLNLCIQFLFDNGLTFVTFMANESLGLFLKKVSFEQFQYNLSSHVVQLKFK